MSRLERLLDPARVKTLETYAITDAPDLVGALEADHASIGKLLHLSPASVDELHERALKVLDPAELAIVHDAKHNDQFGAWDPSAK